MTVKLKIQLYQDRQAMVLALASSGYKVWEETEEDYSYSLVKTYYICFEMESSDADSD